MESDTEELKTKLYGILEDYSLADATILTKLFGLIMDIVMCSDNGNDIKKNIFVDELIELWDNEGM